MDRTRYTDPTHPTAARRRWTTSRWVLVPALLLGVLAAGTGCDESVDAIVGSDIPFTVWGFMNAGADTQYVRVFPVTDQLIPDPRDGLDARVFSTNLTTGERREWAYEAVRFDSLISGHFFWSPFRAEHEHRYRLEVIRSDGEVSNVEVTVPSEVDFDIQVDLDNPLIPVEIRGNVPYLIGLRVTYHAVNVPPMLAWPAGTPISGAVQLPVTIVYDDIVERIDDGWRVEINMARDYTGVQSVFGRNCLITVSEQSAPDIWLRTMEFTALAADSTWAPPGGVFDPNILSVPGTFSNVNNGYGFFGAGQGIHQDWTPSVETNLAAGYNFEPKCQGLAPRNVPECWNPPIPCVDESLRDLWLLWLR